MILSLYDAPFVYVQKPTGGRWQHALQLMQDAKGWQIQATWRNMVQGCLLGRTSRIYIFGWFLASFSRQH